MEHTLTTEEAIVLAKVLDPALVREFSRLITTAHNLDALRAETENVRRFTSVPCVAFMYGLEGGVAFSRGRAFFIIRRLNGEAGASPPARARVVDIDAEGVRHIRAASGIVTFAQAVREADEKV